MSEPSWTTTLRCPECLTIIRYHNQAPPWRESEKRRRLMDEADLWLAEHEGSVAVGWGVTVATTDTAEARKRKEHAENIRRYLPVLDVLDGAFNKYATSVNRNADLRCVDCPSCGAEVFVEDAVSGQPEG